MQKKPNPEEKQTLELGIKHLIENKADIFIATDPDSDRIGVVIPYGQKVINFTGNQIACICLYHLLEEKKDLPKNAAFVKTIVTTELFREICEKYQKRCFDVLTGFKYIAEKIRIWEKNKEYHFIFGAEESLGYLLGTFVRDKDAATAAGLIAETALYAKKQKLTLFGMLKKIYAKFGVFREKLVSLSFPESSQSMERMRKIMQKLRNNPLKEIASKKIIVIEDYEKRKAFNTQSKKESDLFLPKSNVLRFWLEDQSKVIIRPSGTEPKIKIYAGTQKKRVFLCRYRY